LLSKIDAAAQGNAARPGTSRGAADQRLKAAHALLSPGDFRAFDLYPP
jgi:hypothetical protein